MNNLEYTVFVDAMATGTFGNLLLLPSATTDNSGGQLGSDAEIGGSYIYNASASSDFKIRGELTIATNFQGEYNIFLPHDMKGTYKSSLTSGIEFTNGGILNISAQNGDVRTSSLQSDYKDADIRIASSAKKHVGQGYDSTYVASGKYEAAAISSSTGTLTVISNLAGTISNENSVSLKGYYSDVERKNKADNSSGNTISASAFRTKAMTLNNHFYANLSAGLTSTLSSWKDAKADNNDLSVQGIWVESGDLLVEGDFGKRSGSSGSYSYAGTISAKTTRVQLTAKAADNTESPEGSASAANNTFGAYGIRAENSNIVMKRNFGADVFASLSNVTVTVAASGADKTPTLSATLNAFGMKAKDFTLDGTFNGKVSASINNVSLKGSGGTKGGSANSITISAAAIYMTGTVSVGNYFSGDLNFERKSFTYSVSPSQTIPFDTRIYGLYAGSSLVIGGGRGLIDTNITVSSKNSVIVPTYVTGVYAPTIKAESFGANLDVSSDGIDLVVGIQAEQFVNGTDSVFNIVPSTFDIIGDIEVKCSYSSIVGFGVSIGVLVKTGGNINLRVSSDITADYAFWSGSWTWSTSANGWTGTRNGSGNDKLEIAAGATITGDIDLGDGTDTIYIDSNARVKGDIINFGGRKNITFQLNQYGSVKDNLVKDSSESDLIYDGKFSAETTTLVVDINDAESGKSYYLFNLDAVTNGKKGVTVVYNAETQFITFKNGAVEVEKTFSDGTVVRGTIVNGVFVVSVTRTAVAPEHCIANAVKLELTSGNKLEWMLTGTNYTDAHKLNISYDLYDSNGNFFRTETLAGKDCQNGYSQLSVDQGFTVKNIRAWITDSNSQQRIDTLSVTGGIDANRNVFRMEWSLALAEKLSSCYRFELEYSVKKAGQSDYSNSTVVTLDYLSSFYELANISSGDAVRARLRVKRIGSTEDITVGEWSQTIATENSNPLIESSVKITNMVSNRLGDLASALSVFEWTDMRNAFESGLQYYEIQFFDAELARDLSDDQLQEIWNGTNTDYTVLARQTTSNQFYLTNSDFNKNYYWRVRAVSNNNAQGAWSDTCRYQAVGEDKTPPVKSTICDSITITTSFDYVANTISWSWNKEMAEDESVSGVTEYVIYYKAEGDSEYQRYQLAANKESIYSATLTVLSALNQKYTYYITARDASGNESGKLKFKTLQGDVTAPVNGALTLLDKKYETNTAGGIDLVVTFSINQATDIAGSDEVAGGPSGVKLYTLQYRKLAADGNEVWVTVKTFDDSVFGNGKFEYTAAGIDTRDIPANSNGECPTYWRLCVEDKAGNTATTDITTITAITFNASNMYKPLVSGDYKNFTVTLSWKVAFGDPYQIAGYNVYISVDGTNWELMRSVSAADNLSVTISNLDGLAGKSGYYWAVEAVDSNGFSSGKQFDLNQNSYSYFKTPDNDSIFKNESIQVSYVSGDDKQLWVSITWTDDEAKKGKYILQKTSIGSDYWIDVSEQDTVGFGYTIPASQKNIQYRLVKKYADGTLIYSSVIYTPTGDLHAPNFTDSDIKATRVNDIYNFSWSEAIDGQISAEEAVSGFSCYVLYLSTSSDMSNAIAITVNGTFTSMTEKEMRNKLGDGSYYWAVVARDKAGNESRLMGGKFSTPQGDFNTATTKSTLTIDWEMVDDPRGPNYIQVRQPANLDLTLSIGGDFTDVSGVYYQVTFYSDANCTDDVFSTEKFARTGSVTTYSLNSSNNLIAYLAEYADSLRHNDTSGVLPPYVYWKVTVSDAYGNSRTLDKINKFRFVDETIAEGRPTNDYYAPNAPKLKAVRAVTEDDLSREEFSDLTTAQKDALKARINKYPGSLFLIEWDPAYDGFGIKSYKLYINDGKETTVYDTYEDWDMLTYISAGKVLAGLYGSTSTGKYTFWVTAVDGSGLESAISKKFTYSYFEATKGDIDGNNISDILFQYTGGDNQLGFWMNGTSSWQGQGMAQPTDWEVKGAFDMNVDGKADIVLVGNVTVNGVKGAYIGYYDGGDTSKWVNIGYLTNMDDINWNVKVANITGTRGTSSIIWHDQDHGVLGVWTDGTDNWTQIKGGFSGDWVLKGAGDFNGDGKAEILFDYQGTFYTTDINGNLTNLGTGFGSAQGWEFAAIGDFSCDGQDDMILFNKENGLVVKLEDGLTKSWKKLGQLDANDWFVVGAGDYNGDKKDDLLVRQKSTGMLGYYDGGDFSKWCEVGRGVDSNWTVIA